MIIRPLDLPGDYPRLVELYNQVNPEPVTIELLKEGDSKIPPHSTLSRDAQRRLIGHIRHRVAAVDESGRMIGYGDSWRAPWSAPGKMWGSVIVDQSFTGQGLGARLADHVEGFAREQGATVFMSSIRDNRADSLRFVRSRGYAHHNHMFESTLTLSEFDDARFAGVVDGVKAGGIHFYTLADRPGEETERALWRLDCEASRDIPGFEEGDPEFKEWRKFALESANFRPDLAIIAADGDKPVGMTIMMFRGDQGGLYTGFTGVDKSYRGRKLALALKLLAVETARRHGAPYMRTNNDSRNAPMLAVNRKMGYVPAPGFYTLFKEL